MTTLSDLFDPRRNSLNAIRLLLAIAVIFSHSWPISGYGDDPGFRGSTVGTWAVTGFFIISGYLITASRFSSGNFLDFAWRRILRIYPAFLVVLVLVAFVFAPLSVVNDPASWDPRQAAHYVLFNSGLYIREWRVADTLASNPLSAWNGSLWTLVFEGGCYLLIGVLVSMMRSRAATGVALLVLLILGEGFALSDVLGTGGAQATSGFAAVAQLVPPFVVGGLLYLYRSRVVLNGAVALVSGVLVTGSIITGTFPVVAPIPLALLLFWLAAKLPLREVGRKNDLSYGLYIYAFPIQQVLVLVGVAQVPVLLFGVISLAATLPLAAASWFVVEKPALRMKDALPNRLRGGNARKPRLLRTQPDA